MFHSARNAMVWESGLVVDSRQKVLCSCLLAGLLAYFFCFFFLLLHVACVIAFSFVSLVIHKRECRRGALSESQKFVCCLESSEESAGTATQDEVAIATPLTRRNTCFSKCQFVLRDRPTFFHLQESTELAPRQSSTLDTMIECNSHASVNGKLESEKRQ